MSVVSEAEEVSGSLWIRAAQIGLCGASAPAEC